MTVASARRQAAFTLVELMVATTILLMVMAILLSITEATGKIWRQTSGKIEEFRDARLAFDSMTRRLSQATLNTYWDYKLDSNGNPISYTRQSELRFISGQSATLLSGVNGSSATSAPLVATTHALFFQAPIGYVSNTAGYSMFDNLLNTWGYYIEFSDDSAQRAGFITSSLSPYRYRYRLKELMEPSDSLTIYNYTSTCGSTTVSGTMIINKPPTYVGPSYNGKEWFTIPLNFKDSTKTPPKIYSHVVADNIIAVIFLPKLSPQDEKVYDNTASGGGPPLGTALSPTYDYDSTTTNPEGVLNPKNQLPPIVQVTMVAIDEASANRLAQGNAPPDFGLNGSPKPFTDATHFTSDLQALESALRNVHANYRIFTTEVLLKGAKWSTDQVN